MNYRSIFRVLKKEVNLNYSNVNSIGIKLGIDKSSIHVNDDDVQKIVDYLNSLELVEEKIPYKEKPIYDDNQSIEEYHNKLKDIGYFLIAIREDMIVFSTEYVEVWVDDYKNTSYYIKNSGYNPEDKTSNFHNFLSDLLSEYEEEE